MKIGDNGVITPWYFFSVLLDCSNKEEFNATEDIGNGDKVFHFLSALLPCLVVVFTHFTSNLLEDVPVSMHTIQAALYMFITPYTNKSFCFFDHSFC